MAVVTYSIVQAVFRLTSHILTSQRAVKLVVVNRMIGQPGFIRMLKYRDGTRRIGEEFKIHNRFSFYLLIVYANQRGHQLWVWFTNQVQVVSSGVKHVINAGIQKVKDGRIVFVPAAVKTEIL